MQAKVLRTGDRPTPNDTPHFATNYFFRFLRTQPRRIHWQNQFLHRTEHYKPCTALHQPVWMHKSESFKILLSIPTNVPDSQWVHSQAVAREVYIFPHKCGCKCAPTHSTPPGGLILPKDEILTFSCSWEGTMFHFSPFKLI